MKSGRNTTLFFLSLLTFLVPLKVFSAAACTTTNSAAYPSDPVTGVCGGTPLTMDVEEIATAMTSRGGRVEDIMPCLPSEFRKNFTLIYESKSPHGKCGGFNNPRIVMFSDDGKSIISIPGNKPETGNDCVSCHTSNFRTKWDAYPMWPGAYGSMDDQLTEPERANFKAFGSGNMKSNARYKYLQRTTAPSDVAPYMSTTSSNKNTQQVNTELRPNMKLSRLLVVNNTEKLGQAMGQSPRFTQKNTRAWDGSWAVPNFLIPPPNKVRWRGEKMKS